METDDSNELPTVSSSAFKLNSGGMDNLAHALAGAVLAETGLKRRTALGTATLIIGANLPDLDVIAIPFGAELTFRRGWTHGVLALVVLPLLLAALMIAWDRLVRKRRNAIAGQLVVPSQLLLLSFIAVLSHPVLDWMNTYGVRWLMPFDGTWFYGDALFIVDPWLWLILLGGYLIARRQGSFRAGRIALAGAAAYMILMLGGSLFGRYLISTGIGEFGLNPREVMVGPVPINPFRRQVVLVEADRYLRGTLDLLPRPRLRMSERVVPANWRHPAVALASEDPEARKFLGWSRYPYFHVTPSATGFTVTMDDVRYSDGGIPSWAAVTVEVQPPTYRPDVPAAEIETAMTPIP